MTRHGRSKPAARASRKLERTKPTAKRKAAPRPAARPKPRPKPKPKPKQRTAAKPVKKKVASRPAKKAIRKAAAKPRAPAPAVRKTTVAPAPIPRRAPAAIAAAPARPDPAVEVYEAGIRAMYRQRWAEAAKLFRRVIEGRDGGEAELQERAQQQLHICEDKLGGERGRQEEDPFLLAVVRKNAGEYDEALALCTRGGRQSKDERFAYLAASIHALRGEGEEAARFLELAIDLNPKNRVHAFHDPDFQTLRERGALGGLIRA